MGNEDVQAWLERLRDIAFANGIDVATLYPIVDAMLQDMQGQVAADAAWNYCRNEVPHPIRQSLSIHDFRVIIDGVRQAMIRAYIT